MLPVGHGIYAAGRSAAEVGAATLSLVTEAPLITAGALARQTEIRALPIAHLPAPAAVGGVREEVGAVGLRACLIPGAAEVSAASFAPDGDAAARATPLDAGGALLWLAAGAAAPAVARVVPGVDARRLAIVTDAADTRRLAREHTFRPGIEAPLDADVSACLARRISPTIGGATATTATGGQEHERPRERRVPHRGAS